MPYVTNQGVKIYYQRYGEGQRTMVLAHGMGGNAAIWFNQVAEFVDDFQIVVFDHRHFGRSECAPEYFLPAEFPGDALAILDELEIDSATFICQSMGGWTGLRTALRHPERVSCLVLSNTPAGVDTPAVSTP